MWNKPHRFFFFSLILFLPTQLGYHFWPNWAFVLGRRIDYLSPTIYFTDLLIIATLTTFAISILMKKNSIKNFQRKPDKKIIIGISLFILLSSTNVVFAHSPIVAFVAWMKVLEYVGLATYIIYSRPSTKNVIQILSFSVVTSIFIGFGQIIHQGSLGGILWWIGERTFTLDSPGIAKAVLCFQSSCLSFLRPYATLPHPNVLAGFIGVTFLLLFFQKKPRDFSLVIRMTLIVLSFGILITTSRNALFALFITMLFFYLKNNTARKILITCVGVFLLFLTLPIAPSWFLDNESIVTRQYLMGVAGQMIVSSPLFGVGLHNFLVALPAALVVRTIYFLQPVHNMYILLITELGVIGSTLLLILGILLFRLTKNRSIDSLWFYPLLFLLLIGLLDHYLLTLQQGQLLFTLVISYFLAPRDTINS